MDDVASLVTQYCGASDDLWLSGLAQSRLLMLDWPADYGGPGYTRQQKLSIISQLISAGCPLFPPSITVIAPIIMAIEHSDESKRMLAELARNPGQWRHTVSEDTLYLRGPLGSRQIGSSGAAARLLAIHSPALFAIYELKATLRFTTGLYAHREENYPEEVIENLVRLDSLEGQYLKGSVYDDLQIALEINRQRLETYHQLVEALGYYALLAPDEHLVGNEPLPFGKERAHLFRLRQCQDRDAVIQQDRVYEELLEKIN